MPKSRDGLEWRSAEERAEALAECLPAQIRAAQALPGYAKSLAEVDADAITDAAALVALPVLRKSELGGKQSAATPFGGFTTRAAHEFDHIFQSPGPLYEPGRVTSDWWRLGRFVRAAGLGAGDILQNCFAYHLIPAGMMFESAARAAGAVVLPAGTGQTDLQVRAAADVGSTAYAGTPDFLKVILDRADAMGETLKIAKAMVSGGALYPSLRAEYADRGIACLQCYTTADLGNVAYESAAMEGMIVDEGVIVEIVTPGTGDPVGPGEVGEVLVTSLNPDYPLIRFATGDMSAWLPGESPCGRTNLRIKGWMGRADQTTKVKGLFVRPEQVAALVARHTHVHKARVIVTREEEMDRMHVQIEADGGDWTEYGEDVHDLLKLRGTVEVLAPGELPKDGVVIEDRRNYG